MPYTVQSDTYIMVNQMGKNVSLWVPLSSNVLNGNWTADDKLGV